MKPKFSQFIALLVAVSFCLIPHPALAEGATRDTAGGGNTANADPGANGGFEMPQAQPIQPIQTPKPQSRSSDSGAASALAMVGAMTAMAMCAKLMQEAQKARQEGDTKSAQMYMMMAMQQCQQGAQNLANADKNKDQKNQLQENQTPQLAQLPAQKAFKAPSTPKDAPDLAGLSDKPAPSTDTPLPDPEVTNLVSRDTNLGDNLPSNAIPPSYARPSDGVIIPDLIDKAKITGNEAAKGQEGGGTLAQNNLNNSNSFAGALKAGAAGDLKGLTPNETPMTQANTNSRGIKSSGGGDGAEGANSTLGKSSEGGEGTNINDMMASLFGGGAQGAPAGFMGAQGLIDYTPVPTSPSTGKKMNIFEAASYLYQQAHGKKVRHGKVVRNQKTSYPPFIASLSND